ncbi:MAG: C_GCAxxG_C_C family protein [Cyclobacteriaceae bacterium]|nr:C_GCAxxG_C_C family protein [Cyclobacteriaceae bacterium]
MKKFSRRRMIQGTALAAGSLILSGCGRDQASGKNSENIIQVSGDPEEPDLNEAMSRENIFSMLDQRVEMIMSQSHHCAQSAFLALREQFNLPDGEILKALTPLPGLGEKGLTCGAITGSLMAMGLFFGRDRIDDWETYRASLVPSGEFVDRFREVQGSTDCCEIVETEFGRKYDLLDPSDHADYVKAGATQKCTRVVQRAVRIAADIILREKYGK